MVQPFPKLSRKKNSGTMASADFSWQALLRASEVHPPHVHETSPYLLDLLRAFPYSYRTLICVVISSMPTSLISSFCSSGQMFAAGFLQIPTRDGHPCPWLYTSRYRACYGLAPIRECSCWAKTHDGHPCLGLYTSRYRACYGLAPIRECSCWANNKKGTHQQRCIPYRNKSKFIIQQQLQS